LNPFLAKFDRFAQVTNGLMSENVNLSLVPNGTALLTWFIDSEIWIGPSMIVTGWSQCCAPVSTSWSDTYAQPVTGWTAA
jgi:hypothetical protein